MIATTLKIGDRVKTVDSPWDEVNNDRGIIVAILLMEETPNNRNAYEVADVEWTDGGKAGTITREKVTNLEFRPLRCFDFEQVMGECMCAEILHTLAASGILLEFRDYEQVMGECMCAEILRTLGASGILLDVR